MNKLFLILLSACIFSQSFLKAQEIKKDKAIFKSATPGYYQNVIMKDASEKDTLKISVDTSRKYFIMDMSDMKLPNKVDLYKQEWHFPPISQGNTGTCWCFSTTSFLESEEYRLFGQQIKLSEMYTVYWEYVDKARRYIQEKGNSLFDEGSEANTFKRIYKNYGVVPLEAYAALPKDKKFYNHSLMYKEMADSLKSVKQKNNWDEEKNISMIKSILNKYMGEPPTEFKYKGKKYSPKTFLSEALKLNMDDYVDILSYKQEPYFHQVEYKVPDNWWHDKTYYNVPLDEFMNALKNAIRKGFTVAIGGDVTEPGFSRITQCALIPSFDIPSNYIDENARQFRFSNNTTQDDHGMHLVGYFTKDNKDWFLIKDSGSGSRNNDLNAKEFGYYFFSEDYVKLKMMDFMVNKHAVQDLLINFQK